MSKREWWIQFEGDPQLDGAMALRKMCGHKFEPGWPSAEVVHVVPASELEAALKSIEGIHRAYDEVLREDAANAEKLQQDLDSANKRIEELEAIISHLPKVPTQPYEKEIAKQLTAAINLIEEISMHCDPVTTFPSVPAQMAAKFLKEREDGQRPKENS